MGVSALGFLGMCVVVWYGSIIIMPFSLSWGYPGLSDPPFGFYFEESNASFLFEGLVAKAIEPYAADSYRL